MTARDAFEFGVVDELIDEAPGGAHRDPALTAENVRAALRRQLAALSQLTPEQLVEDRYQKFRKLGPILDAGPV